MSLEHDRKVVKKDGSNLSGDNCTLPSHRFQARTLPIIRTIMLLLKAGTYPARIAKILGKQRSFVAYHIKKLLEWGFIEKEESLQRLQSGDLITKFRGRITLYRITSSGIRFFEQIESKTLGCWLRLHNVVWLFPVVKEPELSIDWRPVELVNWTQFIGCEMGLKVRKNPGNIEVIGSVLDGVDPFELLLRSRDEADRLAEYLENRFKMILGRSRLSRKPHFGVMDPVAGTVSSYFELSTEIANIDRSNGFGEIDWFSPYSAAEYLRMPRIVKELKEEHETLLEGQKLFSEGMKQHMGLIEELQQLVSALNLCAQSLELDSPQGDKRA